MLAIRFGNQIGGTSKTRTDDLHERGSSGLAKRTSGTACTTGPASGAGGAGSSPVGGALRVGLGIGDNRVQNAPPLRHGRLRFETRRPPPPRRPSPGKRRGRPVRIRHHGDSPGSQRSPADNRFWVAAGGDGGEPAVKPDSGRRAGEPGPHQGATRRAKRAGERALVRSAQSELMMGAFQSLVGRLWTVQPAVRSFLGASRR